MPEIQMVVANNNLKKKDGIICVIIKIIFQILK